MRTSTARASLLAMAGLLAAPLLGLGIASAARADVAPEGTEPLLLHAGEVKAIEARNGSQIVCDDPSIAHGDIAAEKFILVAGHEGQTMCGVRFDGQTRAVYLVTVRAGEKEKK